MKDNKSNIETIDEFDDYIQSLDISQLREIENSSKFIFSTELSLNIDNDEQRYLEIDDYIQSLQLSELREIESNSKLLKSINQTTVKHKSKITGLDEKIIILIENKKEKATLEQLLIYCNKLHIPYQKMIPEFFIQYR